MSALGEPISQQLLISVESDGWLFWCYTRNMQFSLEIFLSPSGIFKVLDSISLPTSSRFVLNLIAGILETDETRVCHSYNASRIRV